MTHGKSSTYNDRGCRCNECRAAHAAARAAQRKRRYLRHGSPALVPPTGAVRRVQALQAIGWSLQSLERQMGRQRSYLTELMKRPSITPDTHEAIAALYDELSMTPGTSKRAFNAARRHGYAPPLAWDDIDTDDAPMFDADGDSVDEVVLGRLLTGRPVKATRAERVEAVRRLAATGMSDAEVAAQIAVSVRSVARWRHEFGIESRWAA